MRLPRHVVCPFVRGVMRGSPRSPHSLYTSVLYLPEMSASLRALFVYLSVCLGGCLHPHILRPLPEERLYPQALKDHTFLRCLESTYP